MVSVVGRRFTIPVLVGSLLLLLWPHVASAAASVVATISLAPSRAGVVVANPTTGRVFAAHEDGPTSIKAIDSSTNTIVGSTPTSGFHTGMSVNPTTNRVYVSQQFASVVRVIDGMTSAVITDIPIPSGPIAYNAIDPSLNKLFVLRPNSGSIAVVDTTTNTVAATFSGGCCDAQAALAVDSSSHRLYIANSTSNRVVVIDGANPAYPQLASIPMPSGAFRVAVHAVTQQVYVTHQSLSTVTVIDGKPGSPTENTIVSTINVGAGPFGLAVDSVNNRAYAARPAAQALAIIDTTTNTLAETVAGVPSGNASIAVLPALRRVYVSDDGCKCVNVVEDNSDAVAPTTTATAVGYTFGNWTNAASVNVALAATDNVGGSGVKEISFSASGAQTIAPTVQAGAAVTVPAITAEGVTTITFFATDNAGNIEMEQSVTIKIDRTAPTASCNPSPSTMWPPNHKMVNIAVSVTILDALSGGATTRLISVASNEPDNGLGDGDTAGDIAGWDIGTNDTAGQLRAERSGTGNGRVYTLQYEARDIAGNTAVTQCTVTVPKNRS